MSDNKNFDYKKLSPFKWFVLENFPFIEADFDALTEWQLFCKIGKEINKIIDSQNIVGEQAETLTNAFNNLKNYVDNYFNNLDVQNEINNKLNVMAEDGTLENIINQQIFNKINLDLKNLKNKVFGKKILIIGDSYLDRENSWGKQMKNLLGFSDNNCVINGKSGTGFVNKIDGINFITQLNQNIIPNDELTDIIVCGGWNDCGYEISTILSGINTFCNTAKQLYPNAEIYIGFIPWLSYNIEDLSGNIAKLNRGLYCYKNCGYKNLKAHYLNNVEYSLHDNGLIDNSKTHPNNEGQTILANEITRAWITGSTNISRTSSDVDISLIDANTAITSISGKLKTNIDNGISTLYNTTEIKIEFDRTTEFTFNNFIFIGTLTSGSVIGKDYTKGQPVPLIISTSNGEYYDGCGYLCLKQGKLALFIKKANKSNTGWLTTPLNFITLGKFSFSVNSMLQV